MGASSSHPLFSKKMCAAALWLALAGWCGLIPPALSPAAENGPHWRRGNLHTHTLWSDGDNFPESVAKWYKDHGYDFLVFTDHNVLLEGEKWRRMAKRHHALPHYRELFGEQSLKIRPTDTEDFIEVRLRALSEFRHLYEEPEKYLLIMGNEITDRHSVHLVALHQDRLLPTVGGTVEERQRMVRDIVALVDDYRASSGRNVHAILAHPNFGWAITAEMMVEVADLRFFEVYNGHSRVNNDGDAHRASAERMWDIALALRLSKPGGKILYAVATDDSHQFFGDPNGPGRGWVMVNAASLTPESILDALDRGDFYATTGVTLQTLEQSGEKIRVEIAPRQGEAYLTEYIGTRRGADLSSAPALDEDGRENPNTTRVYGNAIGEVLHRTSDLSSSYALSGDELYVRVRITSTADHLDPVTQQPLGNKQRAWGQPVVSGRKAP